MKNINLFLKSKLKEKNMRIDTFIAKAEVSKSTIYRVMKGYQRPSEELLDKMSAILNLNALEQQELRYYSNLLNADEDVLSARDEVFNLLYDTEISEPDKIELVYYDDEKYIRTFNNILGKLLNKSSIEGFSCRFRMVNCCHDSIVQPLFTAISSLMKNEKNYTFEHLVNFSTYNSKENVIILNEIIPLLPLDNYTVMYCETEGTSGNSIFYDFLMIDYQYTNESGNLIDNHLYISFLRDNISTCYVVNNENLQEFFERNYESLHHDYTCSFNNQKKFEFIGTLFLELEINYDVCLFKPNPCYNRIPVSVYESVKARSSKEMLHFFMNSFLYDNVTKETIDTQLADLIAYLDSRVDASYKNTQIDIFTQKGLESFASTGRLSDHLDGFPPFIPSEIKAVLEYIKSRDLDEKDKYSFFITKSDKYSNEDLLISVFKNHGLLIEYNNPKYKADDMPYCVIEHKGLSNLFSDFAENYVPTMLSMPQKDAYDFIDRLIEKYC